MKLTAKLPRVAETVDEVVVVEWVRKVGDLVQEGDTLMRVESDKAIIDVPAPMSGRLVECLVPPDAEITTGTAFAVLETA